MNVFHNVEIQYLVKQGQVEVRSDSFVHNYLNCLLINRNVVESLNKIIKVRAKLEAIYK